MGAPAVESQKTPNASRARSVAARAKQCACVVFCLEPPFLMAVTAASADRSVDCAACSRYRFDSHPRASRHASAGVICAKEKLAAINIFHDRSLCSILITAFECYGIGLTP